MKIVSRLSETDVAIILLQLNLAISKKLRSKAARKLVFVFYDLRVVYGCVSILSILIVTNALDCVFVANIVRFLSFFILNWRGLLFW